MPLTGEFELDDPATRGFANRPRLVIKSRQAIETKPRRFWFGREGSGQFNPISPQSLAEILNASSPGSAAIKDKSLWAVREHYIQDSPTMRDIKFLSFVYFHLDACTPEQVKNRSIHTQGAYREYVWDNLTLINGWSSRSSVFNSTGIYPHVMEVDVKSSAPGGGTGLYYAPVSLVENVVKNMLSEYYEVRLESEPILGYKNYDIRRTSKGIPATKEK